MKAGGVVQAAGVDREGVGYAQLAAEDEAAADGAGVAHRVSAIGCLRCEGPARARDAERAAGKAHERDEARARRLLAIRAIAVSREERLALRLLAPRAAKGAARVTPSRFAHTRRL